MALRVLALVLYVAAAVLPSSANLIFTPTGAHIQIIMGFGIPVDLPHQAVTMGYVIKSNYMTPNNATQFTRPLEAFTQRSARSARRARRVAEAQEDATTPAPSLASRWHLYRTLQLAVEELGAGPGNGRQCMLRAICEAAAFTMHHDGLLGELLHVVLTPSSTREPVLQHEDYEFHAAESAGRRARGSEDPVRSCHTIFSGCTSGTLDLVSRLMPF